MEPADPENDTSVHTLSLASEATKSTELKNDTSCEICQSHQITHSPWGLSTFRFLHEPCTTCDPKLSHSHARLCVACRHIRIWHLINCCPENSYVLVSYDHKESSEMCDLWIFLLSCATKQQGAKSYASELSRSRLRIEVSIDGWNAYQSFSITPSRMEIPSTTFSARKSRDGERRLHPKIDWRWLQSVLENRGAPNPQRERSKRLLVKRPLQNVLVIDIKYNCIVPLPQGCPFVALSYVWGAGRVEDLKLTSKNINRLMSPEALVNVDLPTTIRDAIEVCNRLDERFLWVDRLCVVQDKSDTDSLQLNQMASLYCQAIFTIIDAAGASAAHGLAGVSRARETEKEVKLLDDFSLVENPEDLQFLLRHSAWWERAWTYQEYMASSTLLFFTKYELYLYEKSNGELKRESESESTLSSFSIPEGVLPKIEEYSGRKLSFWTDKLRAFSGILQTLCGDRVSFGLPWDNFAAGILWKCCKDRRLVQDNEHTAVFPTWSWACIDGFVKFVEDTGFLYGLAYWGRFEDGHGCSSKRAVGPPKPLERYARLLKGHLFAAILAWNMGCIRSSVPDSFKIDCPTEEHVQRLAESWSPMCPSTYWLHVFGDYDEQEIFKDIPDNLSDVTGRILVYTQKASFTLDQKPVKSKFHAEYDRDLFLVRHNGRIAGHVELDVAPEQIFQDSSQICADFISVAVSLNVAFPRFVGDPKCNDNMTMSISEFYGCPCSKGGSSMRPEEHFVECPDHPQHDAKDWYANECPCSKGRSSMRPEEHILDCPDHPQADERAWYAYKGEEEEEEVLERYRAMRKHISTLLISDADGNILHPRREVPSLEVLLIAPSPVQKESITIYQRIGIGRIYLKRWLEASPEFETIVLE